MIDTAILLIIALCYVTVTFVFFKKLANKNQELKSRISKLENKKFTYRTGRFATHNELGFTLYGSSHQHDRGHFKGDKLSLERYLDFIDDDLAELREQVAANKNLKELEKLKAIVAEVCDYVYGDKK